MPKTSKPSIIATTTLATLLLTGQASASKALVDADWLQKNLDNPKVRVIEVSVDTGVYERGYIQGALKIN
jgi:thiosulfate/3-mercaptopyruvate sulfurtransferase